MLVLFGIALAIYQIADRIVYYYQYPTAININVENNAVLQFPQVTICNENVIFNDSATKMGEFFNIQT